MQSKALERSISIALAISLLSRLALQACRKFNKTCSVLHPSLRPPKSGSVSLHFQYKLEYVIGPHAIGASRDDA